jgi:hypothetical protein
MIWEAVPQCSSSKFKYFFEKKCKKEHFVLCMRITIAHMIIYWKKQRCLPCRFVEWELVYLDVFHRFSSPLPKLLSGLACILLILNHSMRWFGLPHAILLDKLSAYGVSGHSVSLLKSFLSNRKQQIKVNSVLNNWTDIHKGVPQRSIQG